MAYKRIHIFYSGNVQGVGFRYTAVNTASELGILGWVRNLYDGRVELVIEGEGKKIKRFLENIEKDFPQHYIKGKEILWEEPTKEFNSFQIRF